MKKIIFLLLSLRINDYPTDARRKVCSRDFISSILEMTGCTVCVRGNYVESGKKIRLELRSYTFMSKDLPDRSIPTAYKEIKRIL